MFRFEPTAKQSDFDAVPGLRDAWHEFINGSFEDNLYGSGGALAELKKWGCSDVDIRFFNPASMPTPADSSPSNVTWTALPKSYDEKYPGRTRKLHAFLDKPRASGERKQDEYCEWVVTRNADGRIARVVFTSEPPDYYEFLYYGAPGVDRKLMRALLVELYQSRCGTKAIKLAHLQSGGEYDWNNRWNREHAVHMNQENNTLSAQINIAARASILRMKKGALLTDAAKLIACAEYGDGARQSDPAIGAAVNEQARANRFLTLENPVGLYMTGLDTSGWTAPDGSPAQNYWRVLRGSAHADPARSMIVRAELAVPSAQGFTVSDLEIGGVPIEFGAQVAAHIQMRLGVVVSGAADLPMPRAIGCFRDVPKKYPSSAMPRRRRGR